MPNDDPTMAECFGILVNIEDFPDFLPQARALATDFLAAANYRADAHYAPFAYSPAAFDQRMEAIYDDLVEGMDDRHWLDTGGFSDAAVVENLRQRAPFNLVDGAWLQNILNTGPCNQVQANLFAIWVDEAGNGRTELNHCNVYDTLLRSVDVYLPAITSRAFVELDFLPSAFVDPVFQMCVGLFPQAFLPELLGMTLYLEWESTPTLAPMVRLLEGRDIDPHFYRLHVAIDNIASGHGALAKEAVRLYLDDIREKGGDAAVESQWERIWNGYVAWATIGSFGQDLRTHLQLFDGKLPERRKSHAEEQMAALIARKAPVARKSHGNARLAGSRLNDLFDDPKALMAALLEGPDPLMDPADPPNSRFLRQLISVTGPMFKVFTDAEVQVILRWLEATATGDPPEEPPEGGPGDHMRQLVAKVAARAQREPMHNAFSFLEEDGTEKTVAAWFQGPPEDLMGAMARSDWVNAGAPQDSRFLTEVLGSNGMMAGVLSPADEDVIRQWILAGCPSPTARSRSVEAVPETGATFASRRQTIGHGSVH